MKVIELIGNGVPNKVCRCVEVADVGAPAPNEAVVQIAASAINPADLLIFEGRYPGPDVFPARVGIEGASMVGNRPHMGHDQHTALHSASLRHQNEQANRQTNR